VPRDAGRNEETPTHHVTQEYAGWPWPGGSWCPWRDGAAQPQCRFVVQAPPGGAIDVIARLNAQRDRPALSAAAGGAWPGLGGGEPCGGQQHHRRRRDRPRRAGWPQFSGEIRHPPDGRARGASCATRPTPRPTHVFGTRHPRHDLLGAARCDGGDAPSCPPVLGRGRSVLLARHGVCCVGARLRVAVFTSVDMKDKAATLLASPPHGLVSYLTPGETEKTAAMLLSDTPFARAWDYWLTRAGFGGIESGMRSTPFVHRTRTICLVASFSPQVPSHLRVCAATARPAPRGRPACSGRASRRTSWRRVAVAGGLAPIFAGCLT